MSQPCNNCHAPCCRNYNVVITLVDAYRIAHTLAMPIVEVAEMRYIDEPDGEYRIKLTGKAESEPRFHRIVLRKVPDPDPQYNGRCMFLVSVGDRGRCGIYSMRPWVCATYPTSFDDGVLGLNAGGKYCPPNAWHLEQIDVPMFRARQIKRYKQKYLHDELIKAWNARLVAENRDSTVTEFFAYCVTMCGELEKFAPGSTSIDEYTATDLDPELALDTVLERLGWPRGGQLSANALGDPITVPNEASAASVSSTEAVQ